MRKLAVLAALAALGSTLAVADELKVYDYTGQPQTIPDGNPVGVRFEIFVPDHGNIIDVMSVNLFGLTHTWVGDLIITLVHKDSGPVGNSAFLLNRLGVSPDSTFGNSNNLDGNYSFQMGAPPSETLAVPAGIYGPAGSFDVFRNKDKYGRWSLHVSDNAGSDFGALVGWSLEINNVPEPTSLSLLALAGLVGLRRRG